jgi:hypothetical protein
MTGTGVYYWQYSTLVWLRSFTRVLVKPDKAALSLSAHESLRTQTPHYIVRWFIAALDVPPQTAVDKHWCSPGFDYSRQIRMWTCLLHYLFLPTFISWGEKWPFALCCLWACVSPPILKNNNWFSRNLMRTLCFLEHASTSYLSTVSRNNTRGRELRRWEPH